MYINKEDHPELWAAKMRRFKRKVDQIVADSREAHRLLQLELQQEALQRQEALEAQQRYGYLRIVK